MAENFIEDLMDEYYKTRGYFTLKNYWFPFQSERNRTQRSVNQKYEARSWSDMDVIAINDRELHIIQVKAIINSKETSESIIKYFERVKEYLNTGKALDDSSDISWWSKKRKIKFILVYEYYSPPSYVDPIKLAGIEVYEFKEKFKEIKKYILERDGSKEEKSVVRMLHYLKHENIIKL